MHARAAGLAGMHVCARDGWKMRVASQPILTVPFRKFHTPSTRALHPARAPCGRARTPTTRAVLEFLSNLRGSPGEKYRILPAPASVPQAKRSHTPVLSTGLGQRRYAAVDFCFWELLPMVLGRLFRAALTPPASGAQAQDRTAVHVFLLFPPALAMTTWWASWQYGVS